MNAQLTQLKKDILDQDLMMIKLQEKLEGSVDSGNHELVKIFSRSLKGSKDETLAIMSYFIDLYGFQTEHTRKAKNCTLNSSFHQN